MAFFVTFNRHILMIKKIRLLNRESLSDTVKPCTIIWSNGINCHFFSKTLDNLDSVEVAVVEPVPLRGVTFLIQRQPLLSKVGIYSIDIGRFDGWKDFCGSSKCVSSFYHIIERYLIDTRVDLACLLPHTWNCIMDELIMKCAQIF